MALMQWLLLFPLLAQSIYYGPTSPPSPFTPHLVQVQVEVYDDPADGGQKVESAVFNQISMPLKPADVYGFRAGGGFQLPKGDYPLVWETSRGENNWPRTVKHKQMIKIQDKDVWVQITIQGEKVTIL